MSCALPQMPMRAFTAPRPSPNRVVAAVNEPRFHTANPKPKSRLRAKVGASTFDHSAAADCVAKTAAPMATKARMPSTVSITRALKAASKAPSERSVKICSRALSVRVALMVRTPRMLSWIHDVSRLLRSRARRNAARSGDENFHPKSRIGATVRPRIAASHGSKAATTASAKTYLPANINGSRKMERMISVTMALS